MLGQLNKHLEEHHLLPPNISAYRAGYNAELVLLKVQHDILKAMDDRRITAVLALDLSAAFDTVDHDILLAVLKAVYGINNTALKWFDEYLHPRKVCVQIRESKSEECDLSFSVPQRSCAGPVLFNIYISTLLKHIDAFPVSFMGYVDDQLVYSAFEANSRQEEESVKRNLEVCLEQVSKWMAENRLKLNTNKTEFVLFDSQVQLQKCTTNYVQVGGDTVSCADSMKYLGMWLDNSLTMKLHIKQLCKKVAGTLHQIKKIRKYLTRATCEQLMVSLVLSQLDYGNARFYHMACAETTKLGS